MPSKVPKAALAALAQKVRQNPDALKNLAFADSTTSVTAVKTQDLRLDVHKNTQNSKMATGIIQANSEARSSAIKDFVKGSTGGHKGTHQVIGEKIRFGLGVYFDAEGVAQAIENEGAGGEATAGTATRAAAGGANQWTWSSEHKKFYRRGSDGTYEWQDPPNAVPDGEWKYSQQYRKHYRLKPDGTYEWQ